MDMLVFFRKYLLVCVAGMLLFASAIQAQEGNSADDLDLADSLYLTDDVDRPSADSIIVLDYLITEEEKQQQSFFYRGLEERKRDNTKGAHTVLFFYLLFAAALIAYLKWSYPEYLSAMFDSLANYRIARIYFEEDEFRFFAPIIASNLLVIMVLSVLLFFAFDLLRVVAPIETEQLAPSLSTALTSIASLATLPKLLLCFLMAAVIVLIRYFVNLGLSGLLPVGRVFQLYQFNLGVLNSTYSILIFPVVLILAFSSLIPQGFILPIIALLIGIYLVLRIFRGLQVGGSFLSESPVHFLLYLCALEIAPMLTLGSIYWSVYEGG